MIRLVELVPGLYRAAFAFEYQANHQLKSVKSIYRIRNEIVVLYSKQYNTI